VPGWAISISCSDPDNGSTGSGGTANIDVDAGETVTCTFTNTFTPGQIQPVGGTAGLLHPAAFGPASDTAGTNTLVSVAIALLGLGAALLPAAGLCLVYVRRSR
jgi:hypothetical protein